MPRRPGPIAALGMLLAMDVATSSGMGVRPGATMAAAAAEPAARDLVVAQADSLVRLRQFDAAVALLDSAAAAAQAAGDPARRCRYLAHAGLTLKRCSRPRDAEQVYLEAERCALALGDSTLLCEVLFRMAQCVDEQGRPPRAIPMYQRLIDTANACGDRAHFARGHVYLARREIQSGDYLTARDRLDSALVILRELGLSRDILPATMFLGLTSIHMGDHARARAVYQSAVAAAIQSGDHEAAGTSLGNLGFLEMARGDPGRAAAYWRRAYQLLRDHDELRASTVPALNEANALCDLGRFDQARARIDTVLAICKERGFVDREATALTMSGQVARRQGQFHDAARQCRAAMVLLRATDIPDRMIDAVLGLATSLTELDSAAASLALLHAEGLPLRPRLTPARQARVDNELAVTLLKLDRNQEALDTLRRGWVDTSDLAFGRSRLFGMTLMAKAFAANSQPDSALAWLRRASIVWEAERSVPLDPEWREERGAQGSRIATQLAHLTLNHPPHTPAGERVRAAYDLLQQFKTRTLMERMVGPGADSSVVHGATAATVTLAEVQREVLHEGEVLLDTFVGEDSSVAFVVTPDSCHAVELPGESALYELVDLYRAMVARPDQLRGDGQAAFATGGGAKLADLLFARSAPLIAGSRRLLVAADGVLNMLPIGAFPISGAGGMPSDGAAGSDGAAAAVGPLLAGHEIVRVPSATVLAWLRRADASGPTPRPSRPASVLAIAGKANADGGALAGAAYEVRRLGRRFDGVDVRIGPPADHPLGEADLAGFELLHFAAHTRADDQHPWRSCIVLDPTAADALPEPPDPQTEDGGVLRASVLASMHLPARLAVLSGCESGGGLALTGEGVLGLTSSLLTAGVPAVVATLWPVDDHATARLMEDFYDHLSAGETVASALRQAQLAVRARPTTSHPFYWAGFVVVGDGDVCVALRKRGVGPRLLLAGAAMVALALVWGISAARRRRRADASA